MGHRRFPPLPLLPSAAPSTQTKDEAPRSSHYGGATGLLVDAACIDSATRAAPSITPVCVVRANEGQRRGAARSRGAADDREVELLVIDAACIDSATRAAPSITPVCVVRANEGQRRGAARSRGAADDREVELLVRETTPSRGLSASASKRGAPPEQLVARDPHGAYGAGCGLRLQVAQAAHGASAATPPPNFSQ
ncbi:uncharacterized protein [Lolium perenne]|uniref:uncharacterized protein isoform X2 n=1 Tax=Lolium perenne TaxID=4522 RepID=UPI003A99FF60